MVCFTGCADPNFESFVYGYPIPSMNFYTVGDQDLFQGDLYFGSGDPDDNKDSAQTCNDEDSIKRGGGRLFIRSKQLNVSG